MLSIVFAGNPESGKSTLLNKLIGNPVFKSGIAFGAGLTTHLDTHIVDGVKYSDTPGLEDIDRKQAAAAEIQKLLNEESTLKLVFVITLEAGRIRPADVVTMEVILSSISETGVDVDLKYSLIINMLPKNVYKKVKEGLSDSHTKEKFLSNIKGRFGSPKDVLLVEEERRATDNDNVLLSCRTKLTTFVNDAPIMTAPRLTPPPAPGRLRSFFSFL